MFFLNRTEHIRIHMKSAPCKIVTFSHEIELVPMGIADGRGNNVKCNAAFFSSNSFVT